MIKKSLKQAQMMDIAIVGIAGRFPDATNTAEFYRNLCQGVDSVRRISPERIRKTTIPNRDDYRIGGYMEDVDRFDHAFFNISLGEACFMDPRQRILLEVVYETIESAGYDVDYFNGSNTSTFIGDVKLDYAHHLSVYDPTALTGNLNSAVSGRIARHLNLRGGSVMVDTACSSSLSAVHYACNDLILQNSDYALAAGINVFLFPPTEEMPDVGIVSSDGKARSFSAQATGTSYGEAVGCVLLKPLEKALADNNIVYAVIKATGLNQNGSLSGSFTAPNSVAQAELLKKVWLKANVNPKTITYIEAHGTGTQLGDPIEIDGINRAFREFTGDRHFCAVSTVKTNIGHTDTAAGIAGLIKAVLSLRHKKLFPSLHFKDPNPLIDFDNSAIYVNTELREWKVGEKEVRRAGVSSFSLSGTNCHVLLEEAPAGNDPQPAADRNRHAEYLVVLSAKSPGSLLENARALRDFAEANPDMDLENLSYTLLRGRKHYQYRASLCVASAEALAARLAQLTGNGPANPFQVQKTVLLFSDNTQVTETLVEEFCAYSPLFDALYAQCKAHLPGNRHDGGFLAFSFQYCFYKLLESFGIRCKYLLGHGIGKTVISVLKEEHPLGWGVNQSQQYVYANPNYPELDARVEAFLQKERENTLLFVEMGPGGAIAEVLRSAGKFGENVRVIGLGDHPGNRMLHFFRQLYEVGFPLDWANLPLFNRPRPIELPTYRFAKSRCWVEKEEKKQSDVRDWFYEFSWVEDTGPGAGLPGGVQPRTGLRKTYLVVTREATFAKKAANALRPTYACVTVVLGQSFAKLSPDEYTIDARSETDYVRLQAAVVRDHPALSGIIHFGCLPGAQPGRVDGEPQLGYGLYSQFYCAKHFSGFFETKNFQFFTVTRDNAAWSDPASPYQTMTPALVRSITADYPTLRGGSIDFSGEYPAEQMLNIVRNELDNDRVVRFVTYQNDKRYIQLLKNIRIAETNPAPAFREGGVYLITGGASGIGLEVAKHIARQVRCTLIIIGRTKLPSPQSDAAASLQPAATAGRTDALNEIRKMGSVPLYYAADVGVEADMHAVFADLKKKFSRLHGVIHAAGVAGNWQKTSLKRIEDFQSTLGPKVNGTVLLDGFTKALEPDFFVCFSSLNALVPQKNSMDYACANAFLDAYAGHRSTQGQRWVSINWPGWLEVGMARTDHGLGLPTGHETLKRIATRDGISAFDHAFALNRPNVAVADVNLQSFGNNPFFAIAASGQQLPAGLHYPGSKAEPTPPQIRELAADPSLSETEKKVIHLWYSVLKSEQIGVDSDFFDLGGHSLNGMQVLNKIASEFGVELELEDLFDYATVKELSARIDELRPAADVPVPDGLVPVEEQEHYQVSHAQKRLWVLDQINKASAKYNVPLFFMLEGEVNVAALEQCFKTLVQRHESLRTVFFSVDGMPRQRVRDAGSYGAAFKYVDLRTAADKHLEEKKISSQGQQVVFNLEKGPLFLPCVYRLDEQKYVLSILMHHIISDGWSVRVMLQELTILYQSYSNSLPNPVEELHIQYKDSVKWQEKCVIPREEGYWLAKFPEELPKVDLPADDFSTGTVDPAADSFKSVLVDCATTERLQQLAKDNNTSLSNVVLSTFIILLHNLTGQSCIPIGLAVASRNHTNLEKLIGFFVNTIVVKCDIHEDITFEEILKNLSNDVVESLKYQDYPFDLLVEKLNPRRSGMEQPIFNVMYSFQNFTDVELQTDVKAGSAETTLLDPDFLRVSDLAQNFSFSRFDLTLFAAVPEKQLLLTFEFDTSKYKPSTITRWLTYLNGFLNQITANL